MNKFCLILCMCLSFAHACFAINEEKKTMTNESTKSKNPRVLIKTSMGEIKVELNAEKAPLSVKNFLQYVKEGHYNGTIFHRVIDGFMVQGGGFTKDFKQKPTHAPIKNEADNGLKNVRGTLAMARTSDVDSATAQFFINVTDNSFLDFVSKNPREYGYSVFGKVIEGMDVLDKIKKVKTGSNGPHQNVPIEPIEIINVSEI
jgi:peptidyl-prolyl cis-trans isomerase B (cyclophilin B)